MDFWMKGASKKGSIRDTEKKDFRARAQAYWLFLVLCQAGHGLTLTESAIWCRLNDTKSFLKAKGDHWGYIPAYMCDVILSQAIYLSQCVYLSIYLSIYLSLSHTHTHTHTIYIYIYIYICIYIYIYVYTCALPTKSSRPHWFFSLNFNLNDVSCL